MEAASTGARPIDIETLFSTWREPEPPVAICATRRLQQDLLQRYGDAQAAAGHRIWPRPGCLTEEDWLAEAYAETARAAAAEGALLPRPLGRAETDAAWRRIVERDLADQPLLDTAQAARGAARAWALCSQHRIALPLPAEADPDAQAFNRWAARFESLLGELQAEAAERLPQRLSEALAQDRWHPPARLLLTGFDQLSPAFEALLASLREAGCELLWLQPEVHEPERHTLPAVDRDAELALAAQTARALSEAEPAAHIGVVIADLGRRRAAVQRAFDAALCPGRRAEDPPEQRPWNLSLGASLAEQPLAADALDWLDWAARGGRPRPVEEALRLLRSPFGPGAEAGAAVAACELHWRRQRFEVVGLHTAAEQLAHHGAPQPARALEALTLPDGAALPSDWSAAFAQALNALGWPRSERCDSAEFQALQAWNETLAQLGGLDAVLGRVRAPAAASHLREMLTARTFQPRGGPSRIQVMGALEAGGLRFDHLLLLGMDETQWPPAADPNPFIPVAIQRAAGIAGASAEGQLEVARRISARLLSSAPQVHILWPQQIDEQPVAPSPLLGVQDIAGAAADPEDARWAGLFRAGRLEAWADVALPATAPDGILPGGIGRLREQAECPFRGAVRFGLGAQAPEQPGPAPDALERGLLLHAALATLWRELRDQDGLLALSEAERGAAITRATEQALETMRRRAPHRFTAGVRAVEAERLPRRIAQLLAIDAERPAFTVEMIEGAAADALPEHGAAPTVELAGLSLRAIPDRVDRLTDGGRVVIDYKTGATGGLLGERLRAPQLPAYAELVEDCVGVAFARLRAGETGYDGFLDADAAGALPGVRPVEKLRSDQRARWDIENWPELRARWQRQLEELAREILQGTASVTPAAADSCIYCDLHALCRIADKPLEDETAPW